jgi:hypothetical protein
MLQKGGCEMQRTPWWLLDRIVGFDDGEENDDESDDSESESEEEDEEEESGEEEGKPADDPVAGLKRALNAERRQRRQLERENKSLKKVKDSVEQGEQSEKDAAIARATKAETRSEKLAANLKQTTIDNSIIKFANKLKFRDVDDALALVRRDSIEVDQDEDDPTDIEFDEDTVEAAVKKLAKDKPHLLQVEGEGGETGGKLGGRRDRSKDGLDEESLKATYAALRR